MSYNARQSRQSNSSYMLHIFLLLASIALTTLGQPATLSFSDCTFGNAIAPNLRINISNVYGQIGSNAQLGRHLNLTLIGNTGEQIIPQSNETGLEATLFTSSTVLSFDVFSNSTFFCSSLVPPSPLPTPDPQNFFCPLPVGPLAFSAAIPLGKHSYELLTIHTQLRVVDTSAPAVELVCVDVAVTPLTGRRTHGSLYGQTVIVFWVSVGLAVAYWVVVGLARLVAAWDRGGTGSGRTLWSRLEGAGFIVASAVSGEKLSVHPALLRFCTPSMRDIIFHTQFCTSLGMVAVQWPVLAYPLFAQTAWSTLTYNVTLAQGSGPGKHWDPLAVEEFNPPSNFASQLNDPTSPVFINSSTPNTLMMFPPNVTNGMESFAAAVGLRPQDLFGVCLVLFLAIIAGAVAISVLLWAIDHFAANVFGRGQQDRSFASNGPTLVSSSSSKDIDKMVASPNGEDGSGHVLLRSSSIPFSKVLGRTFWLYRIRPNSFHGNVLHGNLFTNGLSNSTVLSVILASLSFAVFSIGLPLLLIVRLWNTGTSKLYDETRTLMMLGPLYNHYDHGSQLFGCIFFACNLIYGITIGCGQKSGTAQAIIILVTEVVASLSTSIWLPWGRGASMGMNSFCFCVARIMVAVLLVILSPAVRVGTTASGWVANALLFLLALIYLGFALILVVKVVEALMRILGRIPFDRSNHSLDSGFFGVLGLLDCCGMRRRQRRRRRRSTPDARAATFALASTNTPRKDNSPRSSTAGPPSVLRPEHAFLPYREDTDDEGGHIMGSWQAFPQAGYAPVEDRPPSPIQEVAPQPKSGFTRLGGGKAHFDSPYAIQTPSVSTSSRQEFPSTERILPSRARSSPSPPLVLSQVVDTPTNRSTVTVNHQVISGLPPGAMSPSRPTAHVRKKSQTAIIEDASVFFTNLQESGSSSTTGLREGPLIPPQIIIEDDGGDSSDTTEPRKNHWFNFRKNRRNSASEGNSPTQPSSADSENNNNGGRTFVVVRNKRPASAGTGAQQKTPGSSKQRPASSGGNPSSPTTPSDPLGQTSDQDSDSRRASHRMSYA